MKHQKKQFAICVRNEGAEDLEIRKIYQILPDARAAKDKHLRVIDESGEDYLYPRRMFLQVNVRPEARATLFKVLSFGARERKASSKSAKRSKARTRQ